MTTSTRNSLNAFIEANSNSIAALESFMAFNEIPVIINLEAGQEDAAAFAYGKAKEDYDEYESSVSDLIRPKREDSTYSASNMTSLLFQGSNHNDLCGFYIDAESDIGDWAIITGVSIKVLETIAAAYPDLKDECDTRIQREIKVLKQMDWAIITGVSIKVLETIAAAYPDLKDECDTRIQREIKVLKQMNGE